ncbi:hypothetical protein LJC74_05460, partial [Eubacteriales bacterium OttesenSCG-928-A19]|nr:hypothetical protein [Eubacteriales bacterium OttesenSCG-928-A19]
MRQTALVRVLIWAFVMVVLAVALVAGLQGFSFADLGGVSMAYSYDNGSEYTAGSGTVGVQSIREIDVSWVAGAVEIDVYDGDTIQFSETAGRNLEPDEMLHYRVKGDKLKIQYCASTRGLRWGSLGDKT